MLRKCRRIPFVLPALPGACEGEGDVFPIRVVPPEKGIWHTTWGITATEQRRQERRPPAREQGAFTIARGMNGLLVHFHHGAVILDADADDGRDFLVENIEDGVVEVADSVDPAGDHVVEHGLVTEGLQLRGE